MPKVHLTDLSIRKLHPPETGTITYWDDQLGVRVSDKGTKSFVLLLGSGRRHTLGRFPIISLKSAREEAARLLAEKTLGKTRPKSITFEDAVTVFLEATQHTNKPRTVRDNTRLLNKHFVPRFRRDQLADITNDDISKIINRLLSNGTKSEARHALTSVQTLFRFFVRRRYIPHSPTEGLQLGKLPGRTRVLTLPEMALLWRATATPEPFHAIVRLCMLTLQRRSEIGHLRAEYIDRERRIVTMPRELMKGNKLHSYPYGDLAAEVIESLPREGYLFPARWGDAVFNGWSKCKRRLDAACPLPEWTLHDLRRGVSHMAPYTAPHVLERLLGHSGGVISGVAAVYNQHAYMDEMRQALTLYEKSLIELI